MYNYISHIGSHCTTSKDEPHSRMLDEYRGCFHRTKILYESSHKYFWFTLPKVGVGSAKKYAGYNDKLDKFIKWFSEESLFKDCFDLVEHKKYTVAKFVINNEANNWEGCPQDLMWVCLYVLRSGFRHPEFIIKWNEVVDDGYDPYLAMLVLGMLMCTAGEGWSTDLASPEDCVYLWNQPLQSNLVRLGVEKEGKYQINKCRVWNKWFLGSRRYDIVEKYEANQDDDRSLTMNRRFSHSYNSDVDQTLKLTKEYANATR